MKINLINLIIFYFLFVAVYAQPGIIDNGFNLSDDCTFGQGESFDSDVFASIIQPDDKVVLGGNFSNYNGTPRSKIARVNTDGSLDASFNPGTGFNFDVFSLILQPDGKMVAGGFFTFYNLSTAPRIVRLNPDGSIDPTFNTGSGFNNAVRALELQPDGKIIAAGNFTSYNGTTVNRIVRLNSDGTLDTSFDPAGGFNAQVLTLSLQSDGKIIAGGEFTSFSGNTANHIVRLMDNGSFDPAFNIGSGFSDDVYTTFIQPDGKILVGGYFSTYNGISINNAIRLNIDGSLDLTFDIGISGPSSIVRCFAVKPDLKILIGGDFNQYEGLISSGIICVNQDGTLDNSFSADTMQLGFNSICIRSDQKIVGSGSFYSLNYKTRNYILCLEPNGGLNWNFNPGIGFDKSAVAICIQPDDKIICGGYFNSYNGVPRSNITRINTDGTIDSSFDPGSGFETIGFFGSYVSSIEIQTDNKIIIGGFFHTYQGIPRNCIARLNPDGSLDTSFDPGTGFLNAVTSVEVQADGKIIVTGFFSSYNGSSANKIIRLNSDGSIDPTFNSGSGFNLNVSKSCIQPDGKILVVGSFTNYNGNACNKIIRLNSDGSVDPSFITGTGFNGYVEGIDIMDDGKIITGGNFTSFNGIVRNRIALLNQDGSLDLSFNPLAGFNNTVWCIKALPNSDFLVGGDFTNYNSSIQNSIARLNIDGGIEPSFNSGLGFNDAVNSFSLQNDGQIVTCGNFTEYNGDCRTRISRIQNECITTYATITPVSCGSHVENGVTYTTSGSYSQTIPNTYWCDSIITINLTILPLPDTSEIVISVCDSFIQNGQAYYSSGVYNQIVPSTSGMCDSVIVIDLTILNSDSILNITSCGPYTENGITYSNSGIYTQIIPNSFGCDSTINIELTVVDIDSSIIKTETTITSVETGSMFQWLDCDCGYCEIAGANSASFTADSLGSFAVVIHKNACTDTSECVLIEPQDFYDLPGYQSLFAEVFAYPVSIIDSCDAMAMTNCEGGISPYNFYWVNQINSQNSSNVDSLCEGIHTLKITDHIGDSLLIDYYITDTANFFTWYNVTTTFVDTVYTAASNCAIDYSSPLDSAIINNFYYVSPAPFPGMDLYYIEIAYYQAGVVYYHSDTLSMAFDGWYLINFSVFCPTKNFNQVKTMLLELNYPATLEFSENSLLIQPFLFPNPFTDFLTICSIPENSIVHLTTMNGEIIKTELTSKSSVSLSLNDISAGIYLIRICTEGGENLNYFIIKL